MTRCHLAIGSRSPPPPQRRAAPRRERAAKRLKINNTLTRLGTTFHKVSPPLKREISRRLSSQVDGAPEPDGRLKRRPERFHHALRGWAHHVVTFVSPD